MQNRRVRKGQSFIENKIKTYLLHLHYLEGMFDRVIYCFKHGWSVYWLAPVFWDLVPEVLQEIK